MDDLQTSFTNNCFFGTIGKNSDCRAAKRFLKTHSIMNNYHKSKLDLASILGSYIQQLSQRAWLRLWSVSCLFCDYTDLSAFRCCDAAGVVVTSQMVCIGKNSSEFFKRFHQKMQNCSNPLTSFKDTCVDLSMSYEGIKLIQINSNNISIGCL